MVNKIIIAVAKMDGETVIRDPGMNTEAVDRLMKDIMAANSAARASAPQEKASEPRTQEDAEAAGMDDQASVPADRDKFDVVSEKVEEQISKFNAVYKQTQLVIDLPEKDFDQSKAIHLARRLIKAELEVYALRGELYKTKIPIKRLRLIDYKRMTDRLISMASTYRVLQNALRKRILISAGVPTCEWPAGLYGAPLLPPRK